MSKQEKKKRERESPVKTGATWEQMRMPMVTEDIHTRDEGTSAGVPPQRAPPYEATGTREKTGSL